MISLQLSFCQTAPWLKDHHLLHLSQCQSLKETFTDYLYISQKVKGYEQHRGLDRGLGTPAVERLAPVLFPASSAETIPTKKGVNLNKEMSLNFELCCIKVHAGTGVDWSHHRLDQ